MKISKELSIEMYRGMSLKDFQKLTDYYSGEISAERYLETLETLKRKNMIDMQVYNFLKSKPLVDIRRARNLEESFRRFQNGTLTGITQDQNLRLLSAELMLVLDTESPRDFKVFYKRFKKLYNAAKKEIISKL